jgi:hypothetical protein
MPDLVVYLADRNWLVLMEAASSAGPEDAPGVPDEPALEGDGRGEEEGVEGGGSFFRAHAALMDGVVAEFTQHAGEGVQVGGPAGQPEAVPASGEGGGCVGGDLPVAVLVGHQVLVAERHPTGHGLPLWHPDTRPRPKDLKKIGMYAALAAKN